MPNYAGTCQGICSYNLVYNFFIEFLSLESSVFVIRKLGFGGALFKRILAWERGIFKNVVLRIKFFLSL